MAPESPSEQARRVFHTFDPEGKTFPKEDARHNNMTFDLYSINLGILICLCVSAVLPECIMQ